MIAQDSGRDGSIRWLDGPSHETTGTAKMLREISRLNEAPKRRAQRPAQTTMTEARQSVAGDR